MTRNTVNTWILLVLVWCWLKHLKYIYLSNCWYAPRCCRFIRVWFLRRCCVLGLNLPPRLCEVTRSGLICSGKGRRTLAHVLEHSDYRRYKLYVYTWIIEIVSDFIIVIFAVYLYVLFLSRACSALFCPSWCMSSYVHVCHSLSVVALWRIKINYCCVYDIFVHFLCHIADIHAFLI